MEGWRYNVVFKADSYPLERYSRAIKVLSYSFRHLGSVIVVDDYI